MNPPGGPAGDARSAIVQTGVAMKAATALSPHAASAHGMVVPGAVQDHHWLAVNIPCRTACPAGTDIPGYLEAVLDSRFDDAYAINLRDNVFPGILGRVCSRPCEDACRHGRDGLGDPVAICFSKRSAADHLSRPPARLDPLFPPSGRRVAVIGAGVAGLTAARELARLGHAVTVFEKHARPGGMLNQGIPAFRLPRALIDREIAQVVAQGVEIRCGVEIGRDMPMGDLRATHDAVVMAAGTLRPMVPDLEGVTARGVEHGLGFLLAVNEGGRTASGGRTLVIGGGYTAMDCARTARRLGSDVTVCYRRGREDMVVLPGELEEYLDEGGTLQHHVVPVRIVTGPEGAVAGVVFQRTAADAIGSDGRRGFVAVPGSDFTVDADHVIFATGQTPDARWLAGGAEARLVGRDGWLVSGTAHRTGEPDVFVAGDFAIGASTLIRAIGHAKRCAREVDAHLSGRERLRDSVGLGRPFQSKGTAPRTTGRTVAMNAIPIHPMPTLPVTRRALMAEVETGYPRTLAPEAASRCYLCHYKFEIDDSRCVLCDECITVKPVPDCIVEIAALIRDDEGRVTGYEPVVAGRTDSLYYNRLWIDQNACVRCGQCEAVCPVGAITIQQVSPVIEAAG